MRKENIARAAKMLDAEIPGWHALIDLDRFEIFNCKHCVLGQVFGRAMEDKLTAILGEKVCYDAPDTPGSGWEDGLNYLRTKGIYSCHFGSTKYGVEAGAFADGNCAWIKEITERRAKDELSREISAS